MDGGVCCGSPFVLEVFGAYVGISSINTPFFLPLRLEIKNPRKGC